MTERKDTLKKEAAKRKARKDEAFKNADPSQLTLEEYIAAKRAQKGSKLSPTNLKIIKEQWNAANPAPVETPVAVTTPPPASTETPPPAPKADVALTVEAANKNLDALISGAQKTIYNMSDAERQNLAKTLTDAGYAVTDFGKTSTTLVSRYKAMLNAAKTTNNSYKAIEGFVPYTDATFLAYATGQQKAGAGAGIGTPSSYTETTVFDATRAANYINNEIRQFLGRDATQKEISTLTAKLQAAQKRNPSKTSIDAKGNRVVSGGIDSQGFLDAEIKKLPEYAKKELGKAQATTEKILNTARDNGINATQNQIDAWTNRIKNGEDIATIQHEIRNLAAIGRSDVIAKQLAAGNDLATIVSPYKQYAQQILEIPGDQLSINDPAIKMAIAGDKPMSLTDYQNALRQDVRWQYTNNAKTAVSDSVQKVLQDFGFMG